MCFLLLFSLFCVFYFKLSNLTFFDKREKQKLGSNNDDRFRWLILRTIHKFEASAKRLVRGHLHIHVEFVIQIPSQINLTLVTRTFFTYHRRHGAPRGSSSSTIFPYFILTRHFFSDK